MGADRETARRARTGRTASLAAAAVLAGLLQGCGASDVGTVQEVEPAWIDGVASEVLLPTGTLRVAVTSVLDGPVQGGEGDGPFVGVRWTVVPGDLPGATADDEPVDVAAVVDGERHELSAVLSDPNPRATAGVLVGVPGGYDVADLRIEVDFDGVRQTLDPWTREVDPGGAAALYAGATRAWQTPRCPDLVPADVVVDDPPFATCETGDVAVRPWTPEAGWAEEGTLWWTVRLTTSEAGAAALGPSGGDGRSWFVTDVVASEVTLDGVAPAVLDPGYQGTDDQFAGGGTTGAVYTFAGPADLPTTPDGAVLELAQTYAVDTYDEVPAPEDGVAVSAEIPVGPAVAASAATDDGPEVTS